MNLISQLQLDTLITKKKKIGIHALLTPTGNKKKDTKILKEFYKTITPKIKNQL